MRVRRFCVLHGLLLLLLLAGAPGLRAQAPHELERSDKIELYLQHLGKVVKVEPELYQSMLLEYELGRSLAELGSPHPDPLLGDFIRRGVEKLQPDLAAARAKLEAKDFDAAAAALKALALQSDPYLSAQARLDLAEAALAAGHAKDALDAAEQVVHRDRQFLLADHRACEIAALAFRALGKQTLEFLQYAILLTDYREVPAEVEARVKARLEELARESGKPVATVAGWMDDVEKLVGGFKTGEDPTQKQQGEILVALDKMIELQEARERNT
jgi:hypothetical protein